MLTFIIYWLPVILLIGCLIIFKKLYVKCTKECGGFKPITHREPITFPVWMYTIYIICAVIPIFNWVLFISLMITLIDGGYFHYQTWSTRDYWYEIPDATIDSISNSFANKIEKLLNKKWVLLSCYPFYKVYKFMIKQV